MNSSISRRDDCGTRARSCPAPLLVSLVFVPALLSGCFSYVPISAGSVEPGQAVRLRLSPEEADRLEAVRMTTVRILDGTVLRRSDVELLVETPVGRLDPQQGTRALNQHVNVPFSEIRDIELRERDRLKTGAVIGGAALLVGIGIHAALQGGSGSRPVDGGGPDENRIPLLFRLPLSF